MVLDRRQIEDYAVVYFGSALFKILRLLFVATFSVHVFACIYFRVKIISALSPDIVSDFYAARDVAADVSDVDHLDSFTIVFIDWNFLTVFVVSIFDKCMPCVAGPCKPVCKYWSNSWCFQFTT